jgi:hypothetical protein
MYILTVLGKEDDGAYAATNPDGERILYLFQEEDDATRFAMMLEDDGYPEMHVIEVDDDLILKTCEMHDCCYTVITKNDIVIPPKEYDYI